MSAIKCSIQAVIDCTTRFDYDEYVRACEVRRCEPEPIGRFAAMSGVLFLAKQLYPDKQEIDAYWQLELHSNAPIKVSTGLGDTIAKITSAMGIQPCGGCEERRIIFNRMFPYKAKELE